MFLACKMWPTAGTPDYWRFPSRIYKDVQGIPVGDLFALFISQSLSFQHPCVRIHLGFCFPMSDTDAC